MRLEEAILSRPARALIHNQLTLQRTNTLRTRLEVLERLGVFSQSDVGFAIFGKLTMSTAEKNTAKVQAAELVKHLLSVGAIETLMDADAGAEFLGHKSRLYRLTDAAVAQLDAAAPSKIVRSAAPVNPPKLGELLSMRVLTALAKGASAQGKKVHVLGEFRYRGHAQALKLDRRCDGVLVEELRKGDATQYQATLLETESTARSSEAAMRLFRHFRADGSLRPMEVGHLIDGAETPWAVPVKELVIAIPQEMKVGGRPPKVSKSSTRSARVAPAHTSLNRFIRLAAAQHFQSEAFKLETDAVSAEFLKGLELKSPGLLPSGTPVQPTLGTLIAMLSRVRVLRFVHNSNHLTLANPAHVQLQHASKLGLELLLHKRTLVGRALQTSLEELPTEAQGGLWELGFLQAPDEEELLQLVGHTHKEGTYNYAPAAESAQVKAVAERLAFMVNPDRETWEYLGREPKDLADSELGMDETHTQLARSFVRKMASPLWLGETDAAKKRSKYKLSIKQPGDE